MQSSNLIEEIATKQADHARLVYYRPDIFYLSPSFNKVTGLFCSDIVHRLQILPNVSYCPRTNPTCSEPNGGGGGASLRNRQRVFLRYNHPIVKVKVVGLITFSGSLDSFEPINKYVIDDGSQARLVLVDRRENQRSNLVPVGCVVKAKGFVSEWNQERQLEIATLKILPSFTEEISQWESIVRSREALKSPWIPINCAAIGIQDFQLYCNVLMQHRFTLSKGQSLQANGGRQVRVLNFQSAVTHDHKPYYKFANDDDENDNEEKLVYSKKPFGLLAIPEGFNPSLRAFKSFLLTYFSTCRIRAFKLTFLLGKSRDVTPLDDTMLPTNSEYKDNINVLLRAARQTVLQVKLCTNPEYNEGATRHLFIKILRILVKEGNLFMPCTENKCSKRKGTRACHCSLDKKFHNEDPLFEVVGVWNIGESIRRYLDRAKKIYLQYEGNPDTKVNSKKILENESPFFVSLRATTIWKSLLSEQPSWSTLQKGMVMDITRQLIKEDHTALWKEEPTASGTWNLYNIAPV